MKKVRMSLLPGVEYSTLINNLVFAYFLICRLNLGTNMSIKFSDTEQNPNTIFINQKIRSDIKKKKS